LPLVNDLYSTLLVAPVNRPRTIAIESTHRIQRWRGCMRIAINDIKFFDSKTQNIR
jgi:hypothetical protein